MARTTVNQTTVSAVTFTPVTFQDMDTTSVSTTLSVNCTATQTFLLLASLSSLNVGDYLLVAGAERALITALPDGSYIASSTLGAGGSGYAVNDTGTVNGGSGGTYIVNTVSSGAVATYTITNTGSGYTSASGVATTRTSGAGSGFTINVTAGSGHTANVTRGVNGTAAIAHSSSDPVISLSVGNVVSSPTSSTVLTFYNADSSSHNVTLYGPTGSQSYAVPGTGYVMLGKLQLSYFIQPQDGSLWINGDNSNLKVIAVKVS